MSDCASSSSCAIFASSNWFCCVMHRSATQLVAVTRTTILRGSRRIGIICVKSRARRVSMKWSRRGMSQRHLKVLSKIRALFGEWQRTKNQKLKSAFGPGVFAKGGRTNLMNQRWLSAIVKYRKRINQTSTSCSVRATPPAQNSDRAQNSTLSLTIFHVAAILAGSSGQNRTPLFWSDVPARIATR